MPDNYLCALDIGSSKISAVVAERKKKQMGGVFFESVPVKGIKRGVITDSIEVVGTLSRVLKNLRNKSGINIKYLYTNVSGLDIVTKHSRSIIPLAERGNKVITQSDVDKVNEQARVLGSSLEEEIIHRVPSGYTIDSKNNVLNPLGVYSHKLEADLYLVCAKLSSVQTLTRAINQSGYEIRSLFFSGIATSAIVFNPYIKSFSDGTSVLCDIGSDLTELILFQDGLLKDIRVLPTGGEDLTLKLARELKAPLDLAEEIKVSYGSVGDAGYIREDKEILVKQHDLYKPIKQKAVSEILTSGAKVICEAMRETLEKLVPLNKINNFVTVGRAASLDGLLEILESDVGVPVKLGRITHPDMLSLANRDSVLSGQNYLNYLTALGMICLAMHKATPQVLSNAPVLPVNPVTRIVNKIRDVYQEYF